MQVVEEGHIYLLDSYEDTFPQEIRFISKKDGQMVHDGCTNEELLRVLIDRMQYLNFKMPCLDNIVVIGDLVSALKTLEHRTLKRTMQGVEGLDVPHKEEI